MKVYITKHALTAGIIEIEAETCDNVNPDMIKDINRVHDYYHGEGRQWHRSKETAIFKAEAMKEAKIKALNKQLEKLKKLTFN